MLFAGQTLVADFRTFNSSGVLTNADTTPTGTLVINGTDNAASVTVTNKATGKYKASVTLPSTITAGDIVQLSIDATISSSASGGIIFSGAADVSELALNSTNSVSAFISASTTNYTFTVSGSVPSNLGVSNACRGMRFVVVAGKGNGQSRIVSQSSTSIGNLTFTFDAAFSESLDSTTVWYLTRDRSVSMDSTLRPSILDSNAASISATDIGSMLVPGAFAQGTLGYVIGMLSGLNYDRHQFTKDSNTTFTCTGNPWSGMRVIGLGVMIEATAGGSHVYTRVQDYSYNSGTDTTTLTVSDNISGANGGQKYLYLLPIPLAEVSGTGTVSSGGGDGDEGGFVQTFTVVDDLVAEGVEGAIIRIIHNGSTYAKWVTDPDGVAEIPLNANSYTYTITCGGFNPKSGSLTVTADDDIDIVMDTISVDLPTDPDYCTINGYTRKATGAVSPNKEIEFRLVRTDITSGAIFPDATETVTSNSIGFFEIELPKGWVYDVRPTAGGRHQRLVVGTDDTQEVVVVIA